MSQIIVNISEVINQVDSLFKIKINQIDIYYISKIDTVAMNSMKNIFVPTQFQIPEWKQCYYDNDTLQQMISFLKKIQSIYSRINKQIRKNNLDWKRQLLQNKSLMRAMLDCRVILQQWNQLFYRYSDKQAKIIFFFVQLKIVQMKGKAKIYQKLTKILHHNEKILLLLENLYIQAYYTNNAINFNIAIQKTALRVYYRQISFYSQFKYDIQPNPRMKRMRHLIRSLLSEIQSQYVRQSEAIQSIAQKRIKKTGAGQSTIKENLAIIVGGIVGVVIMLGLFIYFYLRANNIDLQNNQLFKKEFPVWRGSSYILFYLWVLGFNVLFYQASQINYKMIFRLSSQNLPHARQIFRSAAVLSLIYMILFIIFIATLAGDIDSSFVKYGQVFWLIIVLYVLIPFSGSLFFLKLMLKVVISPCIPINFLIIWVSQQLVSFVQPFGDLFYTICQVISDDSAYCISQTPNFTSAYVMTMLFLRMVQNLKFWYQNTQTSATKKYNFQAPPFLGFIRGFFGFNTAIAALVYRLKLFETSFAYWLVLSILTTLVSWLVDLKGDWGLLGFQHRFLREKLLFEKGRPIYYLFAVLNLGLRTAWVLSISPFVVRSIGFMPFIFLMIISYIEIFRRGVWNMLRIEFQHIKNCSEFRATINDSKILESVKLDAMQKIKNQINIIESLHLQKQRQNSKILLIQPHSLQQLNQNRLAQQNENNSQISIQLKKQLQDLQNPNQLEQIRMKKQFFLFKQLLRQRRQLKQLIDQIYDGVRPKIRQIFKTNKDYIEFQMSQQNNSEFDEEIN